MNDLIKDLLKGFIIKLIHLSYKGGAYGQLLFYVLFFVKIYVKISWLIVFSPIILAFIVMVPCTVSILLIEGKKGLKTIKNIILKEINDSKKLLSNSKAKN
jgi:hypothetical protein